MNYEEYKNYKFAMEHFFCGREYGGGGLLLIVFNDQRMWWKEDFFPLGNECISAIEVSRQSHFHDPFTLNDLKKMNMFGMKVYDPDGSELTISNVSITDKDELLTCKYHTSGVKSFRMDSIDLYFNKEMTVPFGKLNREKLSAS